MTDIVDSELARPRRRRIIVAVTIAAAMCGIAAIVVAYRGDEAESLRRATDLMREPAHLLALAPNLGGNTCLKDGQSGIYGAISDDEARTLAALARTLSTEPARRVRGDSTRAMVETGSDCGVLSGHGDHLYFKKTSGSWKLVTRNPWMS